MPPDQVGAPSAHPLSRSLLRVRGADGQVVGAAFLAASDLACTCAHVVAEALEADESSLVEPGGELHLDFYNSGAEVTGRVVCWIPARVEDDDRSPGPHDIALLELTSAEASAARLLSPRRLAGHRYQTCGFPDGVADGAWAHGVFAEQRANGTFQIESPSAGIRVQPGFSGAPVWDEDARGVVGMVVSSWRDPLSRAAFVIPVQMLVAASGGRLQTARSDDRPFASLTAGLSNPRPLTAFLGNYLGTPARPVPFGGREEELRKLDQWLDDAQQPNLLVVAPAGWGKSTLLAHWARDVAESNRARVAFTPISLRFGTNQRADVESMLVDRLQYLLPGSGQLAPQDLASVLAQEPDPGEPPLLLAFDAIDEASGWRPERDLPLPLIPTAGVRVLISARELPDRNDADWLASLGWQDSAAAMSIGSLTEEGIGDVLSELGVASATPEAMSTLVETLYEATDDGDPLLVGVFAAAIGPAGFVRPDQLPDLTGGLSRYFDLWWDAQRQGWISSGRDPRQEAERATSLFGMIASALGPLSRDELSALSGTESGAVLDEQLTELGRWVIAVAGRARPTYAFAHPRLGAYWREHKMTAPERERTNERLLSYCGEQLQRLRDGADPATASPYALRYLATHRANARASYPDFDALICPEWWQAHRAVNGSDEPFLSDLRSAWDRADEAIQTVTADNDALASELTGHVFRYLLIATSLQSLSSNIPGALLVRLVTTDRRRWPVQWALVQVRRHAQRFKVLSALAPHLGEDESAEAAGQALDSALIIGLDYTRAQALADLGPWVPDQRLGDVVTAALAFPAAHFEARALTPVVPRLSDELLARAWNAVDARGADNWDAAVLAAFAPRLSKHQLGTALSAARLIDRPYSRAEVLAALTPYLPAEQRTEVLREAVDAVAAGEGDSWLPGVCAAVAPRLGREHLALLERLVTAARQVTDLRHRVEALATLAPWLPDDMRTRVLADALSTASTISGPEWRAGAFSALVPWLSEAALSQMLAETLHAARTIGDEHWQAEALAALASHLPDRLVREALAETASIREQRNRAGALAALAPWLPEDLLRPAMQAALTIDEQDERAEILEALAPRLPDEFLAEALSVAQAINDQQWHARALADMAPRVAADQRTVVLDEALKAAAAINDENERVVALGHLAAQLPEQSRTHVVRDALDVAKAIDSPYWLPRMLAALAPQLRGGLLTEAVKTAQAIKNKQAQAEALAALAPQLSEERRASVLGTALSNAGRIKSPYSRTDVIVALAPELPGGLVGTALSITQTLDDDYSEAKVLEVLAPRLPAELSAKALDSALRFTDSSWRAMAVTALVPQLPDALLDDVLTATAGFERPNWRVSALIALAPRLPRTLLAEAFKVAEAISEAGARVPAMVALVRRLPATQGDQILREVLTDVIGMSNEYDRAEALAAVTPQLSGALADEALSAARSISGGRARVVALVAVAPLVPEDQRAGLLADALTETEWFTLEHDEKDAWARLTPLLIAQPVGSRSQLSSQLFRIAAAGSRLTVAMNWPSFLDLIASFGPLACSVVADALIEVPDCYSGAVAVNRVKPRPH